MGDRLCLGEEGGSRGAAGLAEDVYEEYDIARLLMICGKALPKSKVHRIANKSLKEYGTRHIPAKNLKEHLRELRVSA